MTDKRDPAEVSPAMLTRVQRRFAERCTPLTSGCVKWIGQVTPRGYGVIYFAGKMRKAHRVAWYFAHNRWPVLFILHSCDNPFCVNPAHLSEGTHDDNMKDMVKKGRQAIGDNNGFRKHPKSRMYGNKNKMTKLTDDEVRRIRYEKGSSYRLAAKYGVHPSTIQRIINGKTRTHVGVE